MTLNSPIAAFLILPGLQILSLWSPPFPGRSIVFVSAIVACAVILHSEKVSDDPQITYGLGMAWPSYLATIDRLLFSVPEAAFWRVGEKPGEALGYGMFGWKKLKWGAAQIFNPRGIHWNYQVKGIARTEGKREYRSRKAFVKSHAIQFVQLCLGYDILHSFLVSQHRHVGSTGGDYTPLSDHPFIWSFATTAAAAYVMFCGIQLNYLLTSITFVGLGLSRPEDWPPLYGNIWDAFTVRRVWGCFWHKLIRRTLSSYAKFAVRTLRLTDETGAIVHLILTFTLSGIFHALPLRVMLGPDHHGLPISTIFFFASQAIAILFEEAVVSWYVRATGGPAEVRVWHKVIGFLWTTM